MRRPVWNGMARVATAAIGRSAIVSSTVSGRANRADLDSFGGRDQQVEGGFGVGATPARQPNLTPCAAILVHTEPGRNEEVLCVEDWAEIRRLHRAERMPIKVIARVMGCSKNTVKVRWPRRGRRAMSGARAGSIVDEVEPRIQELLAACPTMPATVIAGADRLVAVD